MKTVLLLALVICVASAQFWPFGGSTSSATRCNSAAQCQPNECCVHSPFGKRFLFDDFGGIHDGLASLTSGTCQPKRKEDQVCIPFGKEMNIFSTSGHFAMCPCEDGLVCTSDKTVQSHPQFGTVSTHTNAMCSQPEGSGETEVA